MTAPTIVWFRLTAAALTLGLLLRLRGALPDFGFLRGRLLALLAIAAVSFTLNNLIFLLGLKFTTPEASQVVIQLAPLFLLLGGVALFGERFTGWQWAGLATLLAGMALFFNQRLRGLSEGGEGYFFGIALIVLAAALWAVYALSQKQMLNTFSSMGSMWLIYAVSCLLSLPFARPSEAASLDTTGWLLLAFCCINTVFSYGCFTEALVHWEASRASAVVCTTPLLTFAVVALAAKLFPGSVAPEPLNWISLVGAACVVAGSILAAVGRGPVREDNRT